MSSVLFQLYTEVQARRGGSGMAMDNHQYAKHDPGNHSNPIFKPVHHSNNHHGGFHPPHHHGYSTGHQNGVSEIGDLLQDYLGHGNLASRRNNSARHVVRGRWIFDDERGMWHTHKIHVFIFQHFSDTIKVSRDVPLHQDDGKRRAGNQRMAHEQFLGGFEELENRKNRVSYTKSCSNKENSGSKPPLGQKDAPVAHSRSTAQPPTAESPALDRKSYSPSILSDRKCGSPLVVRKFEAMLQENEGKTLTDAGMATPEVKCATPGCQRRGGAGRAPVQKCYADSEALTAEVEHSQQWGFNLRRGSYSGSKGSYSSPQQCQSRSQVPGSLRTRPRSNSATARKPASHHGDPQKIQRGRLGNHPGCGTDEGLIELLDMLEIQHEYSSRAGHAAYKTQSQEVNPPQWSEEPKRSFSRPARPANQRPPSRWASRTPAARIVAPSGPMYRPPSPLVRSPSPKTRTPSPALKHRPIISYSLPTETVIM
uniref:microtubule cross-linking factor 1-like n=1 Tax=Doryrhamphus excisus TaxID=161450 RepID=UPI0025AE8DF0|nr:microtubule cross-linking factor 1-like [Doryrhamphus excisus]